jgi:hypothetical protein
LLSFAFAKTSEFDSTVLIVLEVFAELPPIRYTYAIRTLYEFVDNLITRLVKKG